MRWKDACYINFWWNCHKIAVTWILAIQTKSYSIALCACGYDLIYVLIVLNWSLVMKFQHPLEEVSTSIKVVGAVWVKACQNISPHERWNFYPSVQQKKHDFMTSMRWTRRKVDEKLIKCQEGRTYNEIEKLHSNLIREVILLWVCSYAYFAKIRFDSVK